MNREKLLLLANLLEADADKPDGMKFDLNIVNRHSSEYDPAQHGPDYAQNCGTAGCAIGLACISPQFPELEADSMFMVRYHGFLSGWENAAIHVFDVTMREIDFLFLPHSYEEVKGAAAERLVAARIRRFVEYGGVFPLTGG